jgi:hypothetical protein
VFQQFFSLNKKCAVCTMVCKLPSIIVFTDDAYSKVLQITPPISICILH